MNKSITFTGCKLTLLLVIFAGSVMGQTVGKTYTLQQCIETALNQNINVQQRELTLRSAEADRFQSKMAALPSLNGQITNNYNTGFAINPITNTTQRDVTFRSNNFGLSSSVNLFNGFQTLNNIRLQQSNAKAVSLELAAAKNNLALQVANAYMQVLLNTEIVDARKLQLAATNEQLRKQEKTYELGGLSKVKYLQIKAQYANEEAQLVNAQTALDQAYLTLWQTINIEPLPENRISKPTFSAPETEKEVQQAQVIYQDFVSRSPEIKAAKQRTESARYAYNMALGGRSLRLSLSGSLSSFYTTQNTQGVGAGNNSLRQIGIDSFGVPVYAPFTTFNQTEVVPFSNQFDRNLGKAFGFTLSVPLFNGWQVNNTIRKQYINQLSAKLTLKQTELDIYKNINQAYLDLTSAHKRYQSSLASYDANQEAFTLADTQFNLGALNTVDYLAIKNQYLQAQTSMLQARYELLFRKKVIDFYTGKSLY